MSKRAAVSQAEITRAVRGAIRGGLPAGSFVVEVVDGIVRLLPAGTVATLPSPDSGEAEWDKALGLQ